MAMALDAHHAHSGQSTVDDLLAALNAVIPDPRNPDFTIHDQHSMLAQRITAIVLGYEDLNDHQELRTDSDFFGSIYFQS